jgi:hypothetical protein
MSLMTLTAEAFNKLFITSSVLISRPKSPSISICSLAFGEHIEKIRLTGSFADPEITGSASLRSDIPGAQTAFDGLA